MAQPTSYWVSRALLRGHLLLDAAFLTTGIMAQRALAAAEQLDKFGIRCGVYHFHTVKPLDTELLESLAGEVPLLISVEEHMRTGGLGVQCSKL